MGQYLSKDRLLILLSDGTIRQLDKLMLVLFSAGDRPLSIRGIKDLAIESGLRECENWNVSDTLSKSKGMVVNVSKGWILTTKGKGYLKDQAFTSEENSPTKADVETLRSHALNIKDPDTISFLEEAISCLEADQKRAAVVFSWIGAVSVLYNEVVKRHLAAFNAEAVKRDPKWKAAKNSDGLGRMKEHEFLDILEAISVIGKNVKQELQQSLQLRNACGHPNSLKIGVNRVSSHIEILILNVFSKF